MFSEVVFFYAITSFLKLEITDIANLTTYLSIVIGFLLSAIAILYSSPLRNLLYGEKASRAENKWYQLMDDYLIVLVVSLMVIVISNVDFSSVQLSKGIECLVDHIPNFMKRWGTFLLSMNIMLSIEFIMILRVLFKNLKFPVNDK